MIYCVNKEKLSVLICRWQICGRMIYSRKTWQTLFLIINGKKMISNGQTGRGMVGLWRKVDYTLAFFRIFILLLFFFVNLSKKTNESLNFLPIERNSVIRERIHLVLKKNRIHSNDNSSFVCLCSFRARLVMALDNFLSLFDLSNVRLVSLPLCLSSVIHNMSAVGDSSLAYNGQVEMPVPVPRPKLSNVETALYLDS